MKQSFENVPAKSNWKDIKTIDQVIKYCKKYFNKESTSLITNLEYLTEKDYEYWVILYRLIVMAITDNEKVSLTKRNLYYPYVQFCKLGKENNCWGDTTVGHISYEGNTYAVIGGNANFGSSAGLGYFDSTYDVSHSFLSIGFRSVSLLEKAKHISKYFGKVVFYIMYGGTNCDWKWEQ